LGYGLVWAENVFQMGVFEGEKWRPIEKGMDFVL